jgi:hypothetical protein
MIGGLGVLAMPSAPCRSKLPLLVWKCWIVREFIQISLNWLALEPLLELGIPAN